MGRRAEESFIFNGFTAAVQETLGMQTWLEYPAPMNSVAHTIAKKGGVFYLLPINYAYKARRILGGVLELNVFTVNSNEEPATMLFAPLTEELKPEAQPPSLGNKYRMVWPVGNVNDSTWIKTEVSNPDDCQNVFEYGLRISVEELPSGSFVGMYGPGGAPFPSMVLYVEYVEPEVWGYGPAGWIDITKDNRFFWSMRYDDKNVIGELKQEAAVFRWKVGVSGPINEVQLTTENEYTVPANTFPKDEQIYWQVVITGDNGETSTNMDWTLLTAYDAKPVVAAISPVGEYIEVRGSVRFAWSYSIETGSKQTAYEVQIKNDSMDWKTIASGQGDASEILVGAELIPAGTLQWRVRGANFDGVFSKWSTPATFVAIAAPTMPSLRVVEATPRPVIAWQGAGQQGYEAQIGDYYSGVVYGTKKEAKSRLYLPDGTVQARVRIVNEFGLWSEWAEIEFQIANEPIAGNVVLKTQGGTDAILSWNVLTDADAYLVYRNGKLIGTTKNGTYKDRLFLGAADYFVRAVQDGSDFYVDSNVSTAETKTEHVMISKYGGEWIDLEYSLTATPSVQTTTNSEVTLMRYMGRTYPMPEYSPQKSRLYKLNVAFKDMREAAAFESLLGELVVVKDQYGNFVVGVMESVQKTQTAFFTSFSTTISQVDEAAYYEET